MIPIEASAAWRAGHYLFLATALSVLGGLLAVFAQAHMEMFERQERVSSHIAEANRLLVSLDEIREDIRTTGQPASRSAVLDAEQRIAALSSLLGEQGEAGGGGFFGPALTGEGVVAAKRRVLEIRDRAAMAESAILERQKLEFLASAFYLAEAAALLAGGSWLFSRRRDGVEERTRTRMAEEQRSLEEMRFDLMALKTVDPLTHLPNRAALFLRSDSYHIAMFDIKHFSAIAAAYDNGVADDLLLDFFVRVVRAAAFPSSEVYRYDTDIAAIVAPSSADRAVFEAFARGVHAELAFYFYRSYSRETDIPVATMAGIACYDGGSGIFDAEMALKKAKARKVGCCVHVRSEGLEGSRHYLDYAKQVTGLDHALRNNAVVAYYQPIVDLRTGLIAKYEALARIVTDKGVVPPGSFIPGADFFGLLPSIADAMFSLVLAESDRNDVTFNLTISDIECPPLCCRILSALAADPKRACRITFEVVETEDHAQSERIENFLLLVKSFGAKVAIDDFGTGYSNFSRIIAKWGVDYIKIDGTIISGIADDPEKRAAVAGIVQIARQSGIKTVAEFVADKKTMEAVAACGVDYGQGYYFGPPAPIASGEIGVRREDSA